MKSDLSDLPTEHPPDARKHQIQGSAAPHPPLNSRCVEEAKRTESQSAHFRLETRLSNQTVSGAALWTGEVVDRTRPCFGVAEHRSGEGIESSADEIENFCPHSRI